MASNYDPVVCLFSHLVNVSREGDGMLLLLLPPGCAVLQHPLLNIPGIRPCEAAPRPAHGSWSGLGLCCLPVWLLQQSAGLHHLSTSLITALKCKLPPACLTPAASTMSKSLTGTEGQMCGKAAGGQDAAIPERRLTLGMPSSCPSGCSSAAVSEAAGWCCWLAVVDGREGLIGNWVTIWGTVPFLAASLRACCRLWCTSESLSHWLGCTAVQDPRQHCAMRPFWA